MHSSPMAHQPKTPLSLYQLSEGAHSPFSLSQDNLWKSGAEFCLILMLSLRFKMNTGRMLHLCLLNAPALPTFVDNLKFPRCHFSSIYM